MSDTPTTSTPATIQVQDNSIPSFDALESVISTPDVKLEPVKAESAEGSPKTKDEQTAMPPKTEEKAPEAKEAKAAPATPKKDIDGNEIVEEGAAAEGAKTVKFKAGPRGREVELPLDAKVTIPVDGQDVEVSLEDLKANYNGKVVYEKKFSELDTNWKKFTQDKQETEAQLNRILDKAINQKDVLGSILEMTEIAGLDAKPVFDYIRDELIGDVEKYVTMSPEERRIHWLEKELNFISRDKQSLAQKKEAEQAQAELQASTSKLRETLGVSDEWMQKAKTELDTNPELAKQYLGDDQKLHQEKTVHLADTLRRQDISVKSLALVKPEFAQNMALLTSAMQYLADQPRTLLATLTPESFAQQIADYLGVPMQSKVDAQSKVLEEKTKLAKKASETQDAEPAPKSAKASKKATTEEDDAFDPRGWDRL